MKQDIIRQVSVVTISFELPQSLFVAKIRAYWKWGANGFASIRPDGKVTIGSCAGDFPETLYIADTFQEAFLQAKQTSSPAKVCDPKARRPGCLS
jgi:hypothetical protein